MKTTENFIAHWLGRCPVKGCKTVMHVDVPMIRERWTETRHDHARGQAWEVPQSRDYPERGRGFSLYGLAIHCAAHKRQISFSPINGRYVEGHVCDARCMNAIGHSCDCSCGGANHGRGHHVELKFDLPARATASAL